MDDVYNYNKERWESLVQQGALFTKPWLDLDKNSAREKLYLEDVVRDVKGKSVLCLAGGGGQQSAAFSILGRKSLYWIFLTGNLKGTEKLLDITVLILILFKEICVICQPLMIIFSTLCGILTRLTSFHRPMMCLKKSHVYFERAEFIIS